MRLAFLLSKSRLKGTNRMTENEARQWAIDCCSRMLRHPAIKLKIDEATRAAIAMTVLTNTIWKVTVLEGTAAIYFRVTDTKQPRDIPANSNKQGTI
jgi:hypothetical protein